MRVYQLFKKLSKLYFSLLGLNLELNIEQKEYIGAFTEEAGVRIDISNQGEMAFPREKGLSAAPGFATSIGMRKASISVGQYIESHEIISLRT